MKAILHPSLKPQLEASSADIDDCLWLYYGRAVVLQRLGPSLNTNEASRGDGARRSVAMIRPVFFSTSSGK